MFKLKSVLLILDETDIFVIPLANNFSSSLTFCIANSHFARSSYRYFDNIISMTYETMLFALSDKEDKNINLTFAINVVHSKFLWLAFPA